MDPNSSNSSSVIDSIRKTDVSRRGGVRVRGGRLPPIRIRDTGIQLAAAKKVIAPKIPPRRIKREERPSTFKGKADNRQSCETADSRQINARGRGRGPKVYLQSEGTFLGEGPAFKLKKEVQTASYERGSRGSRTKTEDTKFDPEGLKYLFEDYDGDESYLEGQSLIMPVRFPIVKQEIKREIKTEIKDEIKEEIKDEIKEEIKDEIKVEMKKDIEIIEIEDDKPFIKKEPFDSLLEECDAEEIKIEEKFKKVDISGTEFSNPLDELKFLKGEGSLLYLQLPLCLPFKKANKSPKEEANVSEKTNQETEMENPEVTLKDLKEGHIGKLQILRSGKMRLVMGSVKMEVESSMEVPTLCDAICISIENEDEGDAVVLGNVSQKMVLRPILSDYMDKAGSLEDTF